MSVENLVQNGLCHISYCCRVFASPDFLFFLQNSGKSVDFFGKCTKNRQIVFLYFSYFVESFKIGQKIGFTY